MQLLRNIVINGAVILALLFGLTLSATAATDFEEIKALAEQGDSLSQNLLGNYYREGKGVRQDLSKAFYWHQKSADQGNSSGQFYVGYAYSFGKGVRQDDFKAFEWFKKSADQNNAFGQSQIGLSYKYGDGVRQNKTTAKEWFGKSCDNGVQISCDQYKRLNEEGY